MFLLIGKTNANCSAPRCDSILLGSQPSVSDAVVQLIIESSIIVSLTFSIRLRVRLDGWLVVSYEVFFRATASDVRKNVQVLTFYCMKSFRSIFSVVFCSI